MKYMFSWKFFRICVIRNIGSNYHNVLFIYKYIQRVCLLFKYRIGYFYNFSYTIYTFTPLIFILPKISKTDERYEMLKCIPNKDLLFVRNQSNTTHTYVFLDNGPFSLSMTEYPEALIYILYKNGLYQWSFYTFLYFNRRFL